VPAGPPIVLDPEREEAELRAYLGADYDHDRLVNWAQTLEDEAARVGDEAQLYRTSQAYLYNLTAFAMSATKEPYLGELSRAVPPGSRLLDYGCGIGSDGLALLEAGYRVEFADFDNPSTRYLRWRLEHRGLEAPVYDLDADELPTGFDLAYAFDVIEHVNDPFGFLAAMERHARLVLVNFLEPAPDETELHRDLPIDELVRHAAERGLRRYRVFHRRSHLVLYDRRPEGVLGRVRAEAALWRGRVWARGRAS
jgi:cyclopropane fatty-acyl-phospholipid synthase-like methyltransferase